VLLLIAFSTSIGGGTLTNFQNPDLVASATPLEVIKSGDVSTLPSILDMLLGNRGGAIGETCAIALVLGGIYLLARKVIHWHTPVIFIGTVFVLSLAIKQDVIIALYEVLGGGVVIGAFFMATDYSTTPINKYGKMVFAFGCGLITVLIRFWGAYPEGVSFAILLMNILSPYIERWCAKKPLGKEGKKNEKK
jgi:electron transport complex protein RnfD